jgi:hypothetical protein
MQDTFDVAVVMPSMLRPQLKDALRSIFAQDLPGRIQVLIGIDTFDGDYSLVESVCDERPTNCAVQTFYPGYSTSRRHGGLGLASDGGVLRLVLSHIANSRYVAYLDDDNFWRSDHLRLLCDCMKQADWAFSLRWFLHPVSRRPICVDEWESVGPGRGLFQKAYGGFVDPSCLMLNKITCEGVLPWWNRPLRSDVSGMSADRNVFAALCKHFKSTGTDQPTVFYQLNPADTAHAVRLRLIGDAYDRAG